MSDLTGKYVAVPADRVGGQPLFGLFVETLPKNPSGGVVYNFATAKYVSVATCRCSVVDPHSITRGFIGVPVTVTEGDFGNGTVEGECMLGGVFRVRVRALHGGCTTLVPLSQVKVRLPPRQ